MERGQDVSVALMNPREQESQVGDWARMIPGEGQVSPGKKRPQSVNPTTAPKRFDSVPQEEANTPESPWRLLVPSPLQSRMAWRWTRSMAADWALVSLNWLLLGALLVPLRMLFPQVRSFGYGAGAPVSLLGIATLHAALITLVGYSEGMHSAFSDFREQGRILGKSVALATSLLCFAYLLQGASWITGGLFYVAGVLHFGALWTWRWRSGESKGPVRREDARNVLIIGAGAVGRRVAASIVRHASCGRRVCGFLDDEKPLGNGVIGRMADLAQIARKEFVDEIILTAPPRGSNLTHHVLETARRLRLDVEIVPELYGCRPVELEIEPVGSLPLICVHAERLPALGLLLKRMVDVLGAGAALVTLSPLLGVIAALIRLDSAGPAFYCAQRAGRKGRVFRCYKFRTMTSNADAWKVSLRRNNERTGPFFKIAGDPRITRLGHYLRRYSLDELPQLWNVVKGDMSLVGPRPHPLDDVAAYEIGHLARLDVTPGITGLWQVTARRDPSFHRGMELDREYIRTWSLGLDARILLLTFLAVVQGSGE
jgi:exopolysaccharide biosynthesis polyprenyl glycosylphosphotransferase